MTSPINTARHAASCPGRADGLLTVEAPELARYLTNGGAPAPIYDVSEIKCDTVRVTMRDGIRLATDIYRPPTVRAPCVVFRTPYGRAMDRFSGLFMSFARRGYVVLSQDCRGTGDSEPSWWDYYVYEADDGLDLVDWICRQSWHDGFISACGSSYVGQTQWCMAVDPRMSTIVPEVSGLGVAINTTRLYGACSVYAKQMGADDLPAVDNLEEHLMPELLAGGFFNEPLTVPPSAPLLDRFPQLSKMPARQAKAWLWSRYCELDGAGRADLIKRATGAKKVGVIELEAAPAFFGQDISHDAHTIPVVEKTELARRIVAPPLIHTGWYDWGLNDALATWALIRSSARQEVREKARLIVTPSAHTTTGYHEHMAERPELQSHHRTLNNLGLLLAWYKAVRADSLRDWPRVIYYLMGANEWRIAPEWPPPCTTQLRLFLAEDRRLVVDCPTDCGSDRYDYDPKNPTPTIGGSIVSSVLLPGSVDVSAVQGRDDVLTYTTEPLPEPVDVVGPLTVILYVATTACDTDFAVRLSDVFPDGRAIQLQSGMLRARYRNPADPALLEPDEIYRLEVDLWATANRFEKDHAIRIDISSSDFPHRDRNSNRGGEPGIPVVATQTICRGGDHASHLLLHILAAQSEVPRSLWEISQ
jgi:uncharacterized protein